LACRPHDDLDGEELRMKSRTEKKRDAHKIWIWKGGWIAYGEVMISMIPGR
jgi:hypothetical protein